VTLVPSKCLTCMGMDPACEKCRGTGLGAVLIPDEGPAFTRECPECGWQNGCYFPQPGMFVPQDGTPLQDHDREGPLGGRGANFCMRCKDQDGHPKHGHMIWRKLS
jgi:hypothetical protein